MKTVSPDAHKPSLLLFGIRCQFTDVVLETLSHHGRSPIARIFPGPPGLAAPIRVSQRPALLPMAGATARTATETPPTYQVGVLDSEDTLELVRSLAPDVIVVACYPRLIPAMLTDLATFGAINIHPSLLPAHRGPDPLFWIMRDGGHGYGVTVHALSKRFDAGDIHAQQAVAYPDGAREHEIETKLATFGAELAIDVSQSLFAGTQVSQQQEHQRATYESWPDDDEYSIDTSWNVRRAWNFVRGVAGRDIPIRITSPSQTCFISDADSYGETDAAPATVAEGQTLFRFADGWMVANVTIK